MIETVSYIIDVLLYSPLGFLLPLPLMGLIILLQQLGVENDNRR